MLTSVCWEKYLIISSQARIIAMKLEGVGYIPCCMDRWLVRWLPLAAQKTIK